MTDKYRSGELIRTDTIKTCQRVSFSTKTDKTSQYSLELTQRSRKQFWVCFCFAVAYSRQRFFFIIFFSACEDGKLESVRRLAKDTRIHVIMPK